MKRSAQFLILASIFVVLTLVVSTLRLFSPSDEKSDITSNTQTQLPAQTNSQTSKDKETAESPAAVTEGGDAPANTVQVPGEEKNPIDSEAKTVEKSVSKQGEVDLQTLRREAEGVSSKQSMKPSYPGINQDNDDVMVASVRYLPGNDDDSFVVIFNRAHGSNILEGTAWVIAEYVQHGTTRVMAMPSHNELNLASDGTPKNPRAGLKLVVSAASGESVSKKFTIKRPGFEGEEITGIRVGVYDRNSRALHLAKVSASRWGKKRIERRVKVETP